jgi:WhiB family redox-sensing transcriptional regulator
MRAQGWRHAALCVGRDQGSWFPANDEDAFQTLEARRVCGECPVRDECLTYAVEAHEKHGIWGGLSPKERAAYGRRVRRERRREQREAVAV